MSRSVVIGGLVLAGLVAGCRDLAAPPTRRATTRPVVELAPAPGSAPQEVLDGGNVVSPPPPAGVTLAINAVTLFDPSMRYDRTTELTVRGDIVGLVRTTLIGDRTGLFVRMNTGGEVPLVYLGPEEWLFTHSIRPSVTEAIMVTGSRADLNGRIVIIARRIVWKGAEIHLRDAEGRPYWSEPMLRPKADSESRAAAKSERTRR
jgi:hypothetical protein